jgi:hypothetical protein
VEISLPQPIFNVITQPCAASLQPLLHAITAPAYRCRKLKNLLIIRGSALFTLENGFDDCGEINLDAMQARAVCGRELVERQTTGNALLCQFAGGKVVLYTLPQLSEAAADPLSLGRNGAHRIANALRQLVVQRLMKGTPAHSLDTGTIAEQLMDESYHRRTATHNEKAIRKIWIMRTSGAAIAV